MEVASMLAEAAEKQKALLSRVQVCVCHNARLADMCVRVRVRVCVFYPPKDRTVLYGFTPA